MGSSFSETSVKLFEYMTDSENRSHLEAGSQPPTIIADRNTDDIGGIEGEVDVEEPDQEVAEEQESRDEQTHRHERTSSEPRANIVLLGAMGCGKSTVGWLLARLIGYGFIDLDTFIESVAQKRIAAIFEEDGEEHFRKLEREALQSLATIRSHVLSVGGGTVVDDSNWTALQEMGTTIWLNPPADEIARRLSLQPDEIGKRPLIAELLTVAEPGERDKRQKLLTERLAALIGQRQERYRQAKLEVSDSFSTPESTANLLKETLIREGILKLPVEQKPYDRWHIL